MKKQAKRGQLVGRLFVLFFFLMLVLVWPLWLLLRGGMDTTNYENRPLAAFPVAGEVSFSAWPAAFEDWLGDHAPFRNQWMALNAAANEKLLGVVDSQIVLAGEDGWLFYKNVDDARPLDDYQGINPYSDGQMAEIAANLERLQSAIALQGTRLAVVIPPGKELVYRRYMPRSIPMVNEQGRIDLLVDYLAENTNVPVLWPEAELRALAATQPVYYKNDTHWNEAGAAYTAALLLQMLEAGGPAPDALQYEVSETPPLRDLANLAALWNLAADDQSWRVAEWMPGVTVEQAVADAQLYDTSYTSDVANGQSLLMFRDSFGASMELPLAACFAESRFVHINAFDAETITETGADVFVIEITQRYADRFLDYLPRLVAWAEGG